MTMSEFCLSISALAIAGSAIAIAIRVHTAVNHLRTLSASISSLNLWLFNYLAIRQIHDPHPHHHFMLKPPPASAVWIWQDGHWELRSEEISLCNAGSPPNRPGRFEGECVLSNSQGSKK